MTGLAGRRIATADGAALAAEGFEDPVGAGGGATIFDPAYWRERGRLAPAARGRGSAWFVGDAARDWVLRHCRRGGFAAKITADRYLWAGEARVRAFAEWRLLAELTNRGLPVPRPVAARYVRAGLLYRCDLITERLAGARPLSTLLAAGPVPAPLWSAVGAAVADLHRAGADHADLNAHNVLVDAHGRVSFIDFDRGRLRRPGAWRERNLRRLRRSLAKLAPGGTVAERARDWDALMHGYRARIATPAAHGSAARPRVR